MVMILHLRCDWTRLLATLAWTVGLAYQLLVMSVLVVDKTYSLVLAQSTRLTLMVYVHVHGTLKDQSL